jgi:hypothetical protein
MAKKPDTPQDRFLSLIALAKKEKVKLTPEIHEFIRSHLEAAQVKLEKGEKLTEEDLAFMDEARGMVKIERLKQIELTPQYGKRLETLATFGFIESAENPVIEGIDKRKYPAPTLEQIMARITPQKAELIEKHIKNPMLLIVPFAMPLKTIAERAGSKKGKLGQNPVYTDDYDIDSDLPKRGKGKEQLIYFPRQYDQTAHGGLTKAEVLASSAYGTFPGWQVLIVDGTETTPEDTRNKSANTLKAEFDAAGLSGLTPEEWLLLHAEGALGGKPFDVWEDDSFTWNLASYLKKGGNVPHSSWGPVGSRAILRWDLPGGSHGGLGSRRVVRI